MKAYALRCTLERTHNKRIKNSPIIVVDLQVHFPMRACRKHTHGRVAKVRAEQTGLSLPSPKQTLAAPTNAWRTIRVGGGVPDSRERRIQARRLSADTRAPGTSPLAEPNRAALARRIRVASPPRLVSASHHRMPASSLAGSVTSITMCAVASNNPSSFHPTSLCTALASTRSDGPCDAVFPPES
jgi:hypothetical protein